MEDNELTGDLSMQLEDSKLFLFWIPPHRLGFVDPV